MFLCDDSLFFIWKKKKKNYLVVFLVFVQGVYDKTLAPCCLFGLCWRHYLRLGFSFIGSSHCVLGLIISSWRNENRVAKAKAPLKIHLIHICMCTVFLVLTFNSARSWIPWKLILVLFFFFPTSDLKPCVKYLYGNGDVSWAVSLAWLISKSSFMEFIKWFCRVTNLHKIPPEINHCVSQVRWIQKHNKMSII